jgi:hypothetical protein
MNTGLLPRYDDGTVVVRRARKDWVCCGRLHGPDGRYMREPNVTPVGTFGTRWVRCLAALPKGSTYVEWLGDSAPYEAGARYCFRCAQAEGLLETVEARGRRLGEEALRALGETPIRGVCARVRQGFQACSRAPGESIHQLCRVCRATEAAREEARP